MWCFIFIELLALIMTGKHPSASQDVAWPKKQQKAVTVGVKLDVTRHTERGEQMADVGHLLVVSESIVQTVCNSAAKTKEMPRLNFSECRRYVVCTKFDNGEDDEYVIRGPKLPQHAGRHALFSREGSFNS
jgi:hypothetical protein